MEHLPQTYGLKHLKQLSTTPKDWWSFESFHHSNRNSLWMKNLRMQNFKTLATSSFFSISFKHPSVFSSFTRGSWKPTEFKSLVNLSALPCSGRCMLKFKDKKSSEVSICRPVIIRLMEILHHLGCINLANNGITYISTGEGFLPSTVLPN